MSEAEGPPECPDYQTIWVRDYEPVPLAGDDASWTLDDLHAQARLEQPLPRREVRLRSDGSPGRRGADLTGPAPAVWTAAQVAATSLALGSYITSALRKWRDKKLRLPEGTRLTLTLTPSRHDDRRERAQIIIVDIHTKTPAEITSEIQRTLRVYAAPEQELPRPGD